MPLIVPRHLPAIQTLAKENIHLATGAAPDASPLRIAVLNLMPVKVDTETDLLRVLSATPLDVEVSFMKVHSHVSKTTPAEHINAFYRDFDDMRGEHFDGFIITGAPVEHLDYEQVDYWPELCRIFDWAHASVRSTLYICWAAQAGLYYHFSIPKYPLPAKMFGIFPQRPLNPSLPLFRGMDDTFNMPHSRHTELRKGDITACPGITLVAESDESGVSIVMTGDGREIFVTGHSEYNPLTLDREYRRDLGKGLPIDMPRHYYRDDNPELGPHVSWRTHGTMLYQNWLTHYVCAR